MVSTSLIIWLREGCDTYNFFAALVILPSCRTVSIYLSLIHILCWRPNVNSDVRREAHF